MSLDRDGYGRHRPVVVHCDIAPCTAVLNTSIPDMEHAKQYAHTQGWLMLVENGVHVHVCPDCRPRYSEKQEKKSG